MRILNATSLILYFFIGYIYQGNSIDMLFRMWDNYVDWCTTIGMHKIYAIIAGIYLILGIKRPNNITIF